MWKFQVALSLQKPPGSHDFRKVVQILNILPDTDPLCLHFVRSFSEAENATKAAVKTFHLKAAVQMPALHHGLFHGLQGTIWSSPWSTCFPPSSLASVFIGLFLMLFFTFTVFVIFLFCPFLNTLNTFPWGTTIFPAGLSCALQWIHWSWLEPAAPSLQTPCTIW